MTDRELAEKVFDELLLDERCSLGDNDTMHASMELLNSGATYYDGKRKEVLYKLCFSCESRVCEGIGETFSGNRKLTIPELRENRERIVGFCVDIINNVNIRVSDHLTRILVDNTETLPF